MVVLTFVNASEIIKVPFLFLRSLLVSRVGFKSIHFPAFQDGFDVTPGAFVLTGGFLNGGFNPVKGIITKCGLDGIGNKGGQNSDFVLIKFEKLWKSVQGGGGILLCFCFCFCSVF